ncbi:hypothetical protein [Streptomyces sp. Ag109_G2-15]|uniref:hypothetical protein n=1 Tax=Streptomyces sp. Ag109_G2-15 TaxID=1938850 RepID=UPI0015CF620E|nr:hypothetical protein [Streptomyces sp. Ag109_G2-15]
MGLAFEAATALLRAAADELPDQPVLVVTLTADERSLEVATRLGNQCVASFEAHTTEPTLAAEGRGADVGREADSWLRRRSVEAHRQRHSP